MKGKRQADLLDLIKALEPPPPPRCSRCGSPHDPALASGRGRAVRICKRKRANGVECYGSIGILGVEHGNL
jgi:hypothetical protein